jgi:hypothetical protein
MTTTVLKEKTAKSPRNIARETESSSETLIEELKAAILEAKAMAEDIRKNGTKGYQTMEEFLKTI